jgi:uncharacterized protein (TIGR03000 family)
MMSRLRFALVALVAVLLPLLAAEQSFAQWRFDRGGWRGGYYEGWGSYSPWYGSYNGYYPYSPYHPYSTYGSTVYTAPYYYGSTYYSPSVYSSSPTMYGNAFVSGTTASGANSTTQSFYPPNWRGDMPAFIDVQVPADAQIWFDGESTSQGGMERTFRSPPLAQGQNYSYEVKARWNENGKDMERTRKVGVHAGERVNVNLMANE